MAELQCNPLHLSDRTPTLPLQVQINLPIDIQESIFDDIIKKKLISLRGALHFFVNRCVTPILISTLFTTQGFINSTLGYPINGFVLSSLEKVFPLVTFNPKNAKESAILLIQRLAYIHIAAGITAYLTGGNFSTFIVPSIFAEILDMGMFGKLDEFYRRNIVVVLHSQN